MTAETKITGRYLAQLVLDRIDQDQAYANLELHKIFKEYGAMLERREKAFITELVYGTLRHQLKIDYILGRLLSRPLASLKITVKNVLRLAIYQLLYLPDIPERAVCHSAVEQIKNSQYNGLTPLVNGVLRSYLRNRNTLEFPDPVLEFAAFLSIEYSHPLWLVKRWLTAFGPDATARILKINTESPPLSLRVNRRFTTADQVMTELANQGIESRPGMFVPEALYLGTLTEPIETMTLFKTGRIFIQDESAMLIAHLLNPVPGELIVDLCAAPGGKSTHLAELMNDCGEIISVLRLARSDERLPTNIGNPREFTILECAELVLKVTGSNSRIVFQPLPVDDPEAAVPGHLEGAAKTGLETEDRTGDRIEALDGLFSGMFTCGEGPASSPSRRFGPVGTRLEERRSSRRRRLQGSLSSPHRTTSKSFRSIKEI